MSQSARILANPSHRSVPLPLRHDTLLGVCEGLGQELGIHANWLRIAFCSAIFLNPAAVIGTYLAIGVAVAAARLAFAPARPADVVPVAAEPRPEPATIAPAPAAAPARERIAA